MANDFLKIRSDLGETVTLEVNTVTYDNVSADRTNSYAAGVSKTVVLGWPDPKFDYNVGGLVDKIDRIMYSLQSDGIKATDRITVSGVMYEVYDASDSQLSAANTEFSVRRSRLFLLE